MQDEGTRQEPLSSAPSPMTGTFVSQPVDTHTPRRYQMFSIVNVIAVVLVIAIIGATSLFLFRHFTTPTVDTSLPTQSAVTTSSQHCLLNLHTVMTASTMSASITSINLCNALCIQATTLSP